tara:strand:- start:60 stop:677 length:618 start_codon:yes stop_codon:yes gene_type:complete
MINKLFYVFLCFLIFSCDLPNEEDRDCNGDQFGTAFIDDCGYCADGNTGKIPNSDKDCCGECFGLHIDCSIACEKCGDDSEDIINYNSCAFDEGENQITNNQSCDGFNGMNNCLNTKGCEWDFDTSTCIECSSFYSTNNDLCIDDLCEDYISQNDILYCDDIDGDNICDLDDLIEDVCFPLECNYDFSFNDLYGKVTWIEIATTW